MLLVYNRNNITIQRCRSKMYNLFGIHGLVTLDILIKNPAQLNTF